MDAHCLFWWSGQRRGVLTVAGGLPPEAVRTPPEQSCMATAGIVKHAREVASDRRPPGQSVIRISQS